MATYLVTGACGFIGANFVQFLVNREPDSQVVAVDNFGFAANEPNLAPVRDRIVLEVADIADYDQMASIYGEHRPDFVVNFAAESHSWSPTVDFDAGLVDTVEWYVENRDWWLDIFERKGDLQISWA